MAVMAHEVEEECDASAYDQVAITLNNQLNMDCPEGFGILEEKMWGEN